MERYKARPASKESTLVDPVTGNTGYVVVDTYTGKQHSWYRSEKMANKVAARFNATAKWE